MAWRYRWSSADVHAGTAKDKVGVLELDQWRTAWSPAKWQRQLRETDDEGLVGRLRRCTQTGRPLASDSFLSKLERKLGRRLRPLPVGRPKKKPERQSEATKR